MPWLQGPSATPNRFFPSFETWIDQRPTLCLYNGSERCRAHPRVLSYHVGLLYSFGYLIRCFSQCSLLISFVQLSMRKPLVFQSVLLPTTFISRPVC
jgi:hypothetical protein